MVQLNGDTLSVHLKSGKEIWRVNFSPTSTEACKQKIAKQLEQALLVLRRQVFTEAAQAALEVGKVYVENDPWEEHPETTVQIATVCTISDALLEVARND